MDNVEELRKNWEEGENCVSSQYHRSSRQSLGATLILLISFINLDNLVRAYQQKGSVFFSHFQSEFTVSNQRRQHHVVTWNVPSQ